MEHQEDSQRSPTHNKTFRWTHEAIKLLLSEYNAHKADFRNKKTKNKQVWVKIISAFQPKGYNITTDDADRKFRNMKMSYVTIKRKHNQSGSGRTHWDYYRDFEEIFEGDHTINPPSVIDSLEDENNSRSNQDSDEILVEISPTTAESSSPPLTENCLSQDAGEQTNNRKTAKNRSLQLHRKRMIELEEEKITEIKKLRDVIRDVGNERNAILRELVKKV